MTGIIDKSPAAGIPAPEGDWPITGPDGALDHTRAPLVEGMQRYQQRDSLPFSTPGHKRGRGIDPDLLDLYGPEAFEADIPVSSGADTIHFGWETWKQAERLGADLWGSERCYYLVNGSSAGNLAIMLATLRPGDEVVIARDIHKSLMVALIHTGAIPVYIAPRLHPELGMGLGIDAGDVAATLEAHPNAKLVVIVSPSYAGVSSNLRAIANVAHGRGIPVYVDEAWGPHFHFHPALPPSAMQSGVDAAVASTHKVLPAITQSAILNVQGALVDRKRLGTTIGMSQTTSPATFILASIDGVRRQLALNGRELMERTIELATDARRRLQAIPGLQVLDGERLGVESWDLTKLVIDVHGLGLTGFDLEEILRERYAIAPEMSDLAGVICLVTIGDSRESIDRLVGAFEEIGREHKGAAATDGGAQLRSTGGVLAPGIQAMSPRDAFYAVTRTVPLRESVGEISAELVIPYPPGIPVLAPGDVITLEKLDYLRHGAALGMYISGPADHHLETIKVVQQQPRSVWLQSPFYENDGGA